MTRLFCFYSLLAALTSTGAFAQDAAVVKLVRGEVDMETAGKKKKLKLNDVVPVGVIVRTSSKSFIRLAFLDKSLMNIGPNSEFKVDQFDGREAGVVSMLRGKVRASVTKDYLELKNKDRSKLFIKTPDAVIGVRGTDFLVSVAERATSTVLFEGEVLMNSIDRSSGAGGDLEAIVEKGVRIFPGEFSVADGQKSSPTVPSLLNVTQLEKLEVNETFSSDRTPSSTDTSAPAASIVPPGLSGTLVANTQESIASVVPVEANTGASKGAPAQGFVKGDQVRPANGSFLHIDSGVVVAPSSDAVLDPVTNTYVGGTTNGQVGDDGDYQPPAGVQISSDGKMTVTSFGAGGDVVKTTVSAPPPVFVAGSPSLATLSLPPSSPAPQWDSGINRPAPSGGIQGVNDPQRMSDLFTDVTLRVQ